MLKIAKKTCNLPTNTLESSKSSTSRVSVAQEDAVPHPILQTKFQTESLLKHTQTKRKREKGSPKV